MFTKLLKKLLGCDGKTLKEWEERQRKKHGEKWKENRFRAFQATIVLDLLGERDYDKWWRKQHDAYGESWDKHPDKVIALHVAKDEEGYRSKQLDGMAKRTATFISLLPASVAPHVYLLLNFRSAVGPLIPKLGIGVAAFGLGCVIIASMNRWKVLVQQFMDAEVQVSIIRSVKDIYVRHIVRTRRKTGSLDRHKRLHFLMGVCLLAQLSLLAIAGFLL